MVEENFAKDTCSLDGFLTKRKSRRRLTGGYNRDCNRPKYLHFVIRAIDFSKVPGARFPCHESHDSCSRAPTPLSPPPHAPPRCTQIAFRLDQRTTTVENAFVKRANCVHEDRWETNNIQQYRNKLATSWPTLNVCYEYFLRKY